MTWQRVWSYGVLAVTVPGCVKPATDGGTTRVYVFWVLLVNKSVNGAMASRWGLQGGSKQLALNVELLPGFQLHIRG